MDKYLLIISTTVQEYFIYRLSFFFMRVRNVLNLVLFYFLWTALYTSHTTLLGYTHAQAITYVMLANLLYAFIFITRTQDLAGQILSGDIINYLLKPFSILKHIMIRELTDKVIHVSFALLEISILLAFAKPVLFFQNNGFTIMMTLMSICIGLILAFFISLTLSCFAFWTTEVWAPRFMYFVMMSMFAGVYFPLDMLPHSIYILLMLTPFPYFIYVPVKIYTHGYTPLTIEWLSMGALWCIIAYSSYRYMFNKGLREFSFFGR